MEVKLNAARNMAGNRLGDIQDRLIGLVGRIDEIEVEIPGFDAVRENQSAILERFDRMEGLVHRLASAEELLERVEGLKRQLQATASQREVARVEEQLLKLADRVDALPADLSDQEALERIEGQLGGLAGEFAEARRQRKSVATALEDHLTEISAQLRDVAETGRTPDLSGLEERISALGAHLAEDRRFVGETLSRLDRRLAGLAEAIAAQEDDTSAEILAGLTEKIDLIAAAIEAQDAPGARDDVARARRQARPAWETARRPGGALVAPADRADREAARRYAGTSPRDRPAHARFRRAVPPADAEAAGDFRSCVVARCGRRGIAPLRAAGRDRGSPCRHRRPRVPIRARLQTQLEAIVSRLELLKGRSIDPARLNELFDRIEVAIRALPGGAFRAP